MTEPLRAKVDFLLNREEGAWYGLSILSGDLPPHTSLEDATRTLMTALAFQRGIHVGRIDVFDAISAELRIKKTAATMASLNRLTAKALEPYTCYALVHPE